MVYYQPPNHLNLNIKKCQIMTYLVPRARLTSNFDYYINREILFRFTSTDPIKNLGVLFDPKLKFDSHIIYKS